MPDLVISQQVSIPEDEIEISAIRSQGPGGQNVNKVATAVHLRFDILASSLPDFYKQRLLALSDSRISKEHVVVIKAQRCRSLEKNRAQALERLRELIQSATVVQKKRLPTRPSRSAKKKRMDSKTRQGRQKTLRAKVTD